MSGRESYPGQRLSFSGALCTVRYFGSIEATKGDWLGVEWDEPGRGKHDGCHKGVRYFECRYETKNKVLFASESRGFLCSRMSGHRCSRLRIIICMNSFVIRVRS